MGFLDRMLGLTGDASTGDGAAGDAVRRSELELALIKRLQDRLGGDDAAADLRLRLRFTGRVQGVGFRWTNRGTAEELGLTGWVRNLDDGSVDMEIQGPAGAIIRHLDAIHRYYARMWCTVWLEQWDELAVVPGETGFEVRF